MSGALFAGARGLVTLFFLRVFFFEVLADFFFVFALEERSFLSFSFSLPIRFSRVSIFFFVLDILAITLEFPC